jgi:hypothetical protein
MGQFPADPDDSDRRPAPQFDVNAARELLARTAELPGTKRELLAVLNEYRAAVYAVATQADNA